MREGQQGETHLFTVTSPLGADTLRPVRQAGELAWAAALGGTVGLVTAVTAVSLSVTPPLGVDAVGRELAPELLTGAVHVAEHLVAAVLAVDHPIAPPGSVETPSVVTRSLLLRTDSELLQLTVHLVRAVPAVEVVVTAPPAGDTLPSPAP